jgi:positive regulator of sigma E activity
MSSFAIYLIGFVVLVVGLALAASMLGVSTTWIAIGIVILVGLGILSGVSRTRQRDSSET